MTLATELNLPRCTRCGEPLNLEDILRDGLPGRTEVWACAVSNEHPKLFVRHELQPCPKCGRVDDAFHCEDSGQEMDVNQQFKSGQCAVCGHGPREHCLDHEESGPTLVVLCLAERCNPHSLDWRVCSRISPRARYRGCAIDQSPDLR